MVFLHDAHRCDYFIAALFLFKCLRMQLVDGLLARLLVCVNEASLCVTGVFVVVIPVVGMLTHAVVCLLGMGTYAGIGAHAHELRQALKRLVDERDERREEAVALTDGGGEGFP